MNTEGSGGGYDGSPKKVDLKAHFQGLKDTTSERRITTEVSRISLELSKNTDIFGYERNESNERLGLKQIQSLNPEAKNIADLKSEDKKIVQMSVFVSLNMTCSEGLQDGLLTDSMTAEEIDEVVPKCMNGVGELIKNIELTDKDVNFIKKVNELNNNNDVFNPKSADKRNLVLSQIDEHSNDSIITKMYADLERDLLTSLGVAENNKVIINEGQQPRIEILGNTEVAESNKELVDTNKNLAGVVEEQTKATKENTEAIERMTYVMKKFTTKVDKRTGLFNPDLDGGESNKRRSRNGLEFKYANVVTELPESEKTKKMSENDRKEMLFKMQLESIEERLDFLENYKTNSMSDLALSEIAYPLFALRDNPSKEVDKRIKDILMARLTMREVYLAMGNNSGHMGERGKELLATISEFSNKGYEVNDVLMKMFFCKDSAEAGVNITFSEMGFRTREAWDWLEYTNFAYDDVVHLAKENGSELIKKRIDDWEKKRKYILETERAEEQRKNPNKEFPPMDPYDFEAVKMLQYAEGSNLEGQLFNFTNEIITGKERALIVKDFLIERLKIELGLDDYHAEKSLQLAEEMSIISLEFYIMDWDFLNGNQYGEMVNSALWKRVDGVRSGKSKLTGPRSTYGVDVLSPGWLRGLCKERDTTQPIYSDNISKSLELDRLTEKRKYAAHFISVICGKVWQAKELMAETKMPDPKELTEEYFRSKLDLFNKADSEIGSKGKLKTLWVAGLFEMILKEVDGPWKKEQMEKVISILTDRPMYSIPEPGFEEASQFDGLPFLSKEQWKFINEALKVDQLKMQNKIVMGVLQTFMTGLSSGKKR